MKYDDASWHSGGDFPADLNEEAGATHIAMFAAWCQLNGLGGELHEDDFADELEQLRDRDITPRRWFLATCDGKLVDDDLNDEGNAFAEAYYNTENAQYATDYAETLSTELESLYHVPDTWASYDRLAPVISKRFSDWRARNPDRP